MATLSTTSPKLDSTMKERVHRLAAARRRSPHWIMRKAVEQYVEREEKREQLRQDALAAWAAYQTTGLHVTAKEADAWLAKLETASRLLSPNATSKVVPTGPAGCGPSPQASRSQRSGMPPRVGPYEGEVRCSPA